MVSILNIVNEILRVRGNLLNIEFYIKDKNVSRVFRAFCPDDQLFGAIKDILLNREYEYLPEFELNKFEGKRVVDAGAHVGLFSLVASTFAKEVISLEPHPVNFKLLQLNLYLNGTRNVVPVNKALWSESKTLTIYECWHTGAHTVLKNVSNKKFNVSSTTLRDIIDELGEIDLLKMDIEGAEFEVLNKLNSKILENIKNIVAECHLEAGDISQLEKFLKEKGYYTVKFTPPLVKKSSSYLIEVKNISSLKILRKILYFLAGLAKVKEKNLQILFARHENG